MPLLHILIGLVYMSFSLIYPLVRQPLRHVPKENSILPPLHVLEYPGNLKLRTIEGHCIWDYAVCGIQVCRASGVEGHSHCTDVHGVVAIYVPSRYRAPTTSGEISGRGSHGWLRDGQAEERVAVRVRGRERVPLKGVAIQGVMNFEQIRR